MAGISRGNAPPWNSPTATTPDLYNTCSISPSFSVPYNTYQLGYQLPHTGNGYAGAAIFGIGNLREYLQVPLDCTLVNQQHYCASYYVNRAPGFRNASNNFGMYFSDTIINISSYVGVLNFPPQINYTSVITDTLNWNIVYGEYVAHGGEKYLLIGNFFNDLGTDTIHQNYGIWNYSAAYYYIDDVNIHCCTCDSTTSLHAGVGEIKEDDEVGVYPNPTSNALTIEVKQKTKQKSILEIKDVLGREILKQVQNDQTTTIDVSHYPSGVYFISLQDEKRRVNKKFVKE